MARAMSRATGAEMMSIRLERVTSRGRFSQGSLAFGTKIAWISLGVRDKSVEGV